MKVEMTAGSKVEKIVKENNLALLKVTDLVVLMGSQIHLGMLMVELTAES